LTVHSLPLHCRLQLLSGDGRPLTRRERDAVLLRKARVINEQATPGNPAPCPMLDPIARTCETGDLSFGYAVIKSVVCMSEMGQAVPLGRSLRVEVVVNVIKDILTAAIDGVPQRLAGKKRRIGQFEFPVEREDLPVTDKPCRRCYAFRGQQIESASLIIIAKQAPRRMRRIAGFDRQFIEGWQTFRNAHAKLHVLPIFKLSRG